MEEDVWIDKLTEWRMNGWVYRRMEEGMCGRREGRMDDILSLTTFRTPPPIYLSTIVTTRINEMNPHN
jgi:hypothetical protein